jgi:16S rRNA (cytosine967-C5)-methyltransferase
LFTQSHIASAVRLLETYEGKEPFHLFAKNYFREHRKHGSRDRKAILQFCYSCFRLGKAAQDWPLDEQIRAGYFLCATAPSPTLEHINPEWNQHATDPIPEKIKWLSRPLEPERIFPWHDQLSDGMDAEAFNLSFLQQPLVYLRVRPGREAIVREKLKPVPHEWVSDLAIAVESNTKLQDILRIDEEVVIQDLSSQAIGELMKQAQLPARPQVWDACAASGGKSILAADVLGNIQLTLSDIRPSILLNLKNRFRNAGIVSGQSMVIDLSDPQAPLPKGLFDLVIADLPCTGSGTWGRNPEQLYFFEDGSIQVYAQLQAKILRQAAKKVKPGGYLLYCTCSVFREENEANVDAWLQESAWERVDQRLIKGYSQKADTLFGALLRRPLLP